MKNIILFVLFAAAILAVLGLAGAQLAARDDLAIAREESAQARAAAEQAQAEAAAAMYRAAAEQARAQADALIEAQRTVRYQSTTAILMVLAAGGLAMVLLLAMLLVFQELRGRDQIVETVEIRYLPVAPGAIVPAEQDDSRSLAPYIIEYADPVEVER